MATFYIDGEAAVNGDGSFASPYNVTPTISSNNIYLYAGDRILNGGGNTAISITAGTTNVVVGAYDFSTGLRLKTGNTRAIITGATQFTVRVNTNANYCTIEMLDVTNTSGVSSACGIYIGNSNTLTASNCTIRNCIIHDIQGTDTTKGIAFRGANFTAHNNVIYNIPNDGIFGYGPGATIYKNKIYNVDQLGFSGDCIQIVGDATLGCSDVNIFENNLSNPNGNKQNIIVQDTTGGSTGGRISHNVCNIAVGALNQAIYVETIGMSVIGNQILGGYYGIYVAGDNAKIIANSITNSKYNGIVCKTGVTGIHYYNNSIVGVSNFGIYAADDTTANIKNNLVFQCNIGIAKHGSATEDYNAYWGCATNQINTGGSASWGSNNITIDPLLTPSKLLRGVSPLIKAGIYISTYLDTLKVAYYNPPSIGAYEYVTERTDAGIRGVR
jgi:hypothetical protein